MKKKNIFLRILVVVVIVFVAGFVIKALYRNSQGRVSGSVNSAKQLYYCPMHPAFTSDKPGDCAICGMTLVKKEAQESGPKTGKKEILYYRNPMNPDSTSPVPMKDSMGMDYVPVYKNEAAAAGEGIYVSPQKQQLIGVKKEKVVKRKLTHEILTVGKVAYDPDLYVAQEEYLQALKTVKAVKKSVLSSVTDQSEALLQAAGRKLLLLGMSKAEISELAGSGAAQRGLYMPGGSQAPWVYITIYEYELGLIKEGMPVRIEAIAYPGETFKGKVVAITPVLDPVTRSAQVRAEVDDPQQKLKPEMFVDVEISSDFGTHLAVPKEAVMDSGLRKIVFISFGDGRLQPVEVKTGVSSDEYVQVLEGLKEGDLVVTSGNFLIDSESKLKSALEGAGDHQH